MSLLLSVYTYVRACLYVYIYTYIVVVFSLARMRASASLRFVVAIPDKFPALRKERERGREKSIIAPSSAILYSVYAAARASLFGAVERPEKEWRCIVCVCIYRCAADV